MVQSSKFLLLDETYVRLGTLFSRPDAFLRLSYFILEGLGVRSRSTLPANMHPVRQQAMTQAVRTQPPESETWIDFCIPDVGWPSPGHCRQTEIMKKKTTTNKQTTTKLFTLFMFICYVTTQNSPSVIYSHSFLLLDYFYNDNILLYVKL